MKWHMKLRLFLRKKFPIETDLPWVLFVLLSIAANGVFQFILYHLGLLPYRDGNGSNGDPTGESLYVGLILQLWVTLLPYQIIGNKKITKTINGCIYLERRVAMHYYTMHGVGFVILNTHAFLWYNRII
jgi:hypothetical protein